MAEFAPYVAARFATGTGTYRPRSAAWISARTGPWLGLTRWWWARAWGHAGEQGWKTADGWRIAQYSLTLLVPNDLAQSVVDRIQAYEQERAP